MSSVRRPPPGPSVSLLTTVRRGVFTPFHEESKTLALPAPTLAVTSTSTFGGTTTRRSPALSRTTMYLSCWVKSTWLSSSGALPKPCSYESASAVMLAGCQVTSPAEPLTGRACSAAVAIPSMSASTIPSAIRPRDRPNQAPSTRPTPTMARATATYPANGIVPCPITSTSPTTPRPSRIREKVTRPRREGGRTGLTGAGAVTSPGCGYGPLVYGPYGANGGWYPGVSTGPVGGAYGGGGGTGADPDRAREGDEHPPQYRVGVGRPTDRGTHPGQYPAPALGGPDQSVPGGPAGSTGRGRREPARGREAGARRWRRRRGRGRGEPA